MPLQILRKVDIDDQEEEALVQEVVNKRLGNAPIRGQVTLRRDLDILSQDEEKRWEQELERRTSEMTPGQPKAQTLKTSIPEAPKVEAAIKCQLCGSRSNRHKADCPTKVTNQA